MPSFVYGVCTDVVAFACKGSGYDLIEVLSERPDYTSEEGDPAPVVYKNGEIVGELKR